MLNSNLPPSNHEHLSGLVERITYYNEETGFGVIKITSTKDKEHTVIGSMPSLSVGEHVHAQGRWVNDKTHGLQFRTDYIKSTAPNTTEGIIKYLGSGLIKGIGPKFAQKMIDKFGAKILDIIEESPQRLLEVDGIGKMRAQKIESSWHKQKAIREIMIFLQSHKVSSSKAYKIYKKYGNNAIKIVSENPYTLVRDIRGMGFVSADTLAKNLGISETSHQRIKAGLSHALLSATSEGHCGMYKHNLIQTARNILSFSEDQDELIEQAIEEDVYSGTLVSDITEDKTIIYLGAYYTYEKRIAESLHNKVILSTSDQDPDTIQQIEEQIQQITAKFNISPAPQQMEAIIASTNQKALIITGGPGTGKTTIVRIISKLASLQNKRIKLCAPTGRAARRLSESSQMQAQTIHSMLGFSPQKGGFQHDQDNQLECDLLIVDEASMIDIPLAYSLMKAVPNNTSVIFIGDINQLPSVGAGQFLRDMIQSEVIKTIKLDQIFRQGDASLITSAAHKVNKGEMPLYKAASDKLQDFYFIETETDEQIIDVIKKLVTVRIPNKFHLDPKQDIAILCPMQKGEIGARAINTLMQKLLNSQNMPGGIEKFAQKLCKEDKVIQLENNYDDNVYNGDIGIINHIDIEDQEITIDFEGNIVTYDINDLDQISLAYSITIHKSQGSEYPAIIIPVSMKHYMMLKRNLIYTAITRGKKLVVLVGQRKALRIAVSRNEENQRISKLCTWLQEYQQEHKNNTQSV